MLLYLENYIFVERPWKPNLTIQDQDHKSLRDIASVRVYNEREEDLHFEKALQEKGINVRRVQFEVNKVLEPSVWLQREKNVLSGEIHFSALKKKKKKKLH